jgi:putative transcriptional regulator
MRKELFEELAKSVKQMKAIEAGEMEPARLTRADKLLQEGSVDVAALRARFKLSQSKFAALLGISVATLQNWEQKRREPEGPAKVLLRVAAHPEATSLGHQDGAQTQETPRRWSCGLTDWTSADGPAR